MANTSQQVFEFRGVDSLYVAEIIEDDAAAYICSTPIYLAPVAEVGKSTDSASEAHYYDNKAMIVINSESADTISITMAPPELAKLAQIIGKSFDPETGMMVDSPRQKKYFALMYRTKGTDGQYRYVSRLKGQFNIPEETSATEDDGTDANNTSIEFTGIYTEHEFTKGKYNGTAWEKSGAKGIVVDTRYGLADVSNFFSQIQTPDTITTGITSIDIGDATATIAVDRVKNFTATITPSGFADGSAVQWTTSDATVARLTGTTGMTNTAIGVAEGEAVITATCGGKSDTCTITVSGS
jgi:phi13 family phage major tail protein